MQDLSHKTLVMLLIVAIVVSIIGVWAGLSKLSNQPSITGLPTEGNATVNILQQIAVNLTNFTIDFGVGFVNSTFTTAFLDTEGGPGIPAAEGNSSGWNQSVIDQAFIIENIGNTIINVSVQADKNGTEFICEGETIGTDCGVGITPPDCDLTNTSSENYLCWWANSEDTSLGFGEVGSCKNVSTSRTTQNNITFPNETNPIMVSGFDQIACSYFNFSAAQNEFVFEVRVIVPNDASGQKNVTFTFSGTASGPS